MLYRSNITCLDKKQFTNLHINFRGNWIYKNEDSYLYPFYELAWCPWAWDHSWGCLAAPVIHTS